MDTIHQLLVLLQIALGQILPTKYVSLAAGIIVATMLLAYIFPGLYFRSKLGTSIPINIDVGSKIALNFVLVVMLEIMLVITWPIWVSGFIFATPSQEKNE